MSSSAVRRVSALEKHLERKNNDDDLIAMANLENVLAEAVKAQKVPHAVVYTTNKDRSFTYKHAVGLTSLEEGGKPIAEDAVFLLASQTKLVATIAALQTVEQGLIGLDDDVATHLPELARQPILKGFDDEKKPILVQRKNKITLRLLLTHSAGVVYDSMSPLLMQLQEQRGHTPNTGADVLSRFEYPLLFEPGESWSYGTGIDWSGLLVERLTGGTLEDFMKKNIWQPLGITSMTFFPTQNAALNERVPVLSTRTPDGKLAPFTAPFINTGSTGCFGGHGMYSNMEDYLKVLHSILANDGKLLQSSTVDSMFKPQLTSESSQGLKDFLKTPWAAFFIGEFLPEIEVNWGLGGILFMQDDEGRRKKYTLSWGGMANPFWSIDREAGIALTFGTQLLPPGDKQCEEVITAVEKGVYKLAGVS